MTGRAIVALCLALAAPAAAAGGRLLLADDGTAAVEIVVARGASAPEREAAEELERWLERVSGADFVVRDEAATEAGPALLVGASAAAVAAGVDVGALGREEWVRQPVPAGLVLAGGRPRGTLYAVFRFLEDEVGVRWWTAYQQRVPDRPRLAVRDRAARGRPAFAYRDVQALTGPRAFRGRMRLNGHFAQLPPSWGGVDGYGPPRHVHDFFDYVPPEVWFDEHPEYFSEVAGLRYTGGQLCLSDPGLRRLMLERLRGFVEEGTAAARADGAEPPRLYDISQMDRGGACECDDCRRLAERAGGQSGVLIDFLNELARGIRDDRPEILVDTLAYHYTLRPPSVDADERIVVRFSGLQRRNFLRPLAGAENAEILAALRGWRERVARLRIWDYTSVFSEYGELPLPNVRVLAADLRLYRELGIDGVFVQHPFPIAGDMYDLKLWVLVRLLEDPDRDPDALVREFTDGYYGPGGRHVRRVLRGLRRAAGRQGMDVGYRPAPADYAYLTPRVLARAHALFDRAEAAVADDAELLARVRHARLSLDRATLVLHGRDADGRFDMDRLLARYRGTWSREIDRRLGEDWAPWAREEVEREIAYWTSGGSGGDL